MLVLFIWMVSRTLLNTDYKNMLVCLFVDIVCASLPIIQSHNYIIYVCYSVATVTFVTNFPHSNEQVVAHVHGCINPTVKRLI